MSVKLNLLPEEYTVSGPVAQAIKLIKPLNVILLALFLAMAVGMSGFFVYSYYSLNSLSTANSGLESQIQAQESAQQQIVLLKDRISQIEIAMAIPSSNKNFSLIAPVLDTLSPNALVSEVDVDSQKTDGSFVFKSNSDLTNFLRSLDKSNNFSTISLTTFSYSPIGGYLVGLDFAKK